MTIAINTRFLLANYLEGYGNFLNEVIPRMARKHPEHKFLLIFDRPFDERFRYESNVLPVVTGPAARHPLLWKWWFDVKIPAVLRKYKADVFVSTDGFCSLRTRVPQVLVLHDLAFLHHPAFILRSHLSFYKKYTPKFLKKAKLVATVSEFSKKDILAHYPLSEDKIRVIHSAARGIFRPIEEEQRTEIREEYAQGKNYFLYVGSIHPRKNLLNLLKAFSIFKKRQKSEMKLVLAGRLAWKNEAFLESLKRYKYRDDVVLTGYIDEEKLAKLMAAAYALVYPSMWEGFGLPVVEAMTAGVPVITSAGTATMEVAGEAALLADPADHESIAEKMMLIYKDENLRRKLVDAGFARAGNYSWDMTADLLWDAIAIVAKA